MPLPTTVTFNELDGSEVAHVLQNRFTQILKSVPYLQRHLTLPRVRMTLNVVLEIWAEQPNPEVQVINDRFDYVHDYPVLVDTIEAETVDTAAPVAGGHPPDQIREMHGLPISQPGLGPREVGAHIATSDYPGTLENSEVEGLPGLRISRTGSGEIDGMPVQHGATVAKIDQGPAGLRSGQMNRDAWGFGRGKSK